jgi:hypothetical protein
MKKYFQKNSRNSKQKWGAFIFAFWIFAMGVFTPIAISRLNPSINYAHADPTASTGTANPQTVTTTDGPYTSTLSIDPATVTGSSFRYTLSVSSDAVNFDLGHLRSIGIQYDTESDFSAGYLTVASENSLLTFAPSNTTTVTLPTTGSLALGNLNPNETYYVRVIVRSKILGQGPFFSGAITVMTATTNPEGTGDETSNVTNTGKVELHGDCGIIIKGSVAGCVASLLELVNMLTHFITSIAAGFFDWALFATIDSINYGTPFVSEGWGIVRDLSNMAFIFILLYIAIQMILGMGHDTRKAIVTLVVVALFINFSMFFSKVIIDAGNILAHSFYNNTEAQYKNGEDGEKSMTTEIMAKITPQAILSDDIVNGVGNGSSNKVPQDTKYILISLFSIAMDIALIGVFFSVGFMMIGRIVGLIFAIIISPLAFISKVVPGLAGMSYIGFDKWIKDLVGLSFLPGVFMFFLFLIIKFLNPTNILSNMTIQTTDWWVKMLNILIPMIFVLVLIMIAKKIAKSMAGEVGGMVGGMLQKLTLAAGGLALGGAALGAAAVGRSTFGAISNYTQNADARKDALKSKATTDAFDNLKQHPYNPKSYVKFVGAGAKDYFVRKPLASIAQGFATRTSPEMLDKAAKDYSGNPAATFATLSPVDKEAYKARLKRELITGNRKNLTQETASVAGDKIHATHVLNEAAQKFKGDKNITFKELTETEKKSVKEKINKDIAAKEKFGGKATYDNLKPLQRTDLITDNTTLHGGSWEQHAHSYEPSAAAQGRSIHTAEHMVTATKADVAMSEFVNALRKGSYDVRNLSGVKSNTTGITKMGVGLIAGVAAGVRTGLKSGGINHGTGQKDMFKDLGSTLKTAIEEGFKSFKVNISVPKTSVDAGGHDVHDDHGGGGHH